MAEPGIANSDEIVEQWSEREGNTPKQHTLSSSGALRKVQILKITTARES